MDVGVLTIRIDEDVGDQGRDHQGDAPYERGGTRSVVPPVTHPSVRSAAGSFAWAGAPCPGVAWVILRSTSALAQEAESVVRPELARGQPAGRASGTSGAATGIPAIVVLLALGLVLRFIIAYVLFPGLAFQTTSAVPGVGQRHRPQRADRLLRPARLPRLSPVYLLLLGAVSFLTGGNIGEGVKVVPMFADLGLAAVVWLMVKDLGVNSRRAFIVALIVLVNPITWFNSAIWARRTRSVRFSCYWACASCTATIARRPRRWPSWPR